MGLLRVVGAFSFWASLAYAADCAQDQPRKEGDPSGQQIASAISSPSDLDTICGNHWRDGDNDKLNNSFNHWGVVYEISRTDNSRDLKYCRDAIQNIIDQCISNDNFWGGVWSYDGETYTITNSMFPNNPLGPSDDGGVPAAESSTVTSAPTKTEAATTGTITPGPQTSLEAGDFSTTTQSIDGLTANSVTTTSQDGHPTVLPIWFVGPGVGIIVIPAAGVIAGGIVPPPAGFPTLTIGEDGNPSTVKEEDDPQTATQTEETTTTSESSSCTQCVDCAMGTASIDLDDDALGDVEEGIPLVIPGGPTPSGSAATPTPTPTPVSSSAPRPSANPIDSPSCASGGIDSKDLIPGTLAGTNGDLRDLLYRLRQEVCAGTCSTAGHGIPGKAVSVFNDNGQCELRVALTGAIEAYMYRGTPATGDQQQQCWDSLSAIIDKCVDNAAKKGWWNGDHEYQFYEGGVRPLNDGNAKNNFELTSWLGPSTVGFTCEQNCRGFIDSTDWCNANCAHRKKRHFDAPSKRISARSHRSTSTSLSPRALDTKVEKRCGISMTFPDYPASGPAGSIPQVTANGWWDWVDENPTGSCARRLRKTDSRQDNTDYATEHIYEKNTVKMYLGWLSQKATETAGGFDGGATASCATMKAVFGSKSPDPNSPFHDQTPAQALANAVTCSGTGCPDSSSRVGEFYLLESSVNALKAIVLGELTKSYDFKQLKCDDKKGWRDNLQKLATLSAVFQYMQNDGVARVYIQVHDRMREVLRALDADPSYSAYAPAPIAVPGPDDSVQYIQHNGWLGAYEYFQALLLTSAQEKSRQFAHNCIGRVVDRIQGDGSLDAHEKTRLTTMMEANRRFGMWTDDALDLVPKYASLMSTDWR